MTLRIAPLAALAFLLGACQINPITTPARSATEEMLISAAAERAADKLAGLLPADMGSVYIDASYFDQLDWKYAAGTIRAAVLRRGLRLTSDRVRADTILEIRVGALSIDKHKFLVGIPEFSLPFPLAGTLTFPEIAFYSAAQEQGVAKFAAVAYSAGTGALVADRPPEFGYSHHLKRTVMLFVSWQEQNYQAEADKDPTE